MVLNLMSDANLLKKFLFITFILISAFFISPGRLSGDALYIFYDAFNFSQNSDIKILENILPRRYLIFIFIYIPTKLSLILFPDYYYSELYYVIPGIISYITTFFWLVTLVMTIKLINLKSTFTTVIVLGFFFCTPMIFLANELIQENFIIFFIVLFLYFEKFGNNKSKLILFVCLLGIILLKIYFIPLIFFLIALSKRFSKIEKIFYFILISFLGLSITIYTPILFDLKNTANTFELVKNSDLFFKNIYLYLFSLNYGLLFNYHIYFLLFIYFIFIGKDFYILGLNILFIFFFSVFPYWHGDMAGSRYMLPINFLNFCMCVVYLKFDQVTKKLKKMISIYLSLVWIFSFSCLDYDIASLNRYNDGAAYAKINNLNYSRNDLFDYENFPYDSYDLHPFYFGSKVRFAKFFKKEDKTIKFNNNIILIKANVYPRSIISVLNYIKDNSDLIKKFWAKYRMINLDLKLIQKIITSTFITSMIYILFIPYILIYFFWSRAKKR